MRDEQTNTVYIAHALKRYPAVFDRIGEALRSVGVAVRPIFATRNIWVRDYFPIQVHDHFVKFAYKGYGGDDANAFEQYAKYPQLVVPESCWCNLGNIRDKPPTDIQRTPIILDGGNVVRFDDRVLMTEIVFTHNRKIEKDSLRRQLSDLLEAEIIFLPPEPGDDLGHTDGIVKWIDNKTVFLNDYRSMREPAYHHYLRLVQGILRNAGIEPVPFPYAYDRCPEVDEAEFRKNFPDADDMNPGWGYYVNYLQVKDAILYPTFGIDDDEWVESCLWDAFPNIKLFPIDCSDLSMEGGLVNCTTMNYVL